MANTYQYSPPDGPQGPVTPIDGATLLGGPGTYDIHATGIAFIASALDTADFITKSSFDLTIQPDGGFLSTAGNWNLGIANAGRWVVGDASGDHNNMYVAGEGVTQLEISLQPTDNVYLQGATQDDITSAFAHAGHSGYNEVVSIPRAGGSALFVSIPDHHGVTAVAAQFHGF